MREILPPFVPCVTNYAVSTLAGSGQGFADGAATSAKFWYPIGLAVDGAGNVYVADSGNHRIRKVAPDGTVSTLAGSGLEGLVNGPAASARFRVPNGIAIDGAGNLFVGDSSNHAVRKIAPDGSVSNLAGTGSSGLADGATGSAYFNSPRGVAVDGSGKVYAADSNNHRIRKIAAGTVSTMAGSGQGFADGQGLTIQIKYPSALVLGAGGSLYAITSEFGGSGCRLVKVAPGGTVEPLAGTGVAGFADGASASAQFSYATNLALDGTGNILVADSNNHRIRKVAPDGTVSTLAGSGLQGFADGAAGSAKFYNPAGLAVDGAGSLYVADSGNHRIRKVAPDGTVSTFAGTGQIGFFAYPQRVVVDAQNNVIVADGMSYTLRKVAPDGSTSTFAGSGSGFADGASSSALFNGVSGLALDSAGNVLAADRDNHRIRKIAPDGTVSTVAGSSAGFADGLLSTARFNKPYGVVVDATGILYVADYTNHAIRKLTFVP